MKQLTLIICGTILMVASGIGLIFFRYYRGNAIPFPIAWTVLLVILLVAGFWMIAKGRFSQAVIYGKNEMERMDAFKAKATK